MLVFKEKLNNPLKRKPDRVTKFSAYYKAGALCTSLKKTYLQQSSDSGIIPFYKNNCLMELNNPKSTAKTC